MKRLLMGPVVAVAALASAASWAQEQPRSMLGASTDLRSMVLSPAPLGPPSHFESAQASATPVATMPPAPRKVSVGKPRQKTAVAARKLKPSLLDSYARDDRRQAWPCSGGGICGWTQPR